MAALDRAGYPVWGVEPAAPLRHGILRRFPAFAQRLLPGSLPDGIPDTDTLGGPFDGIVCSAVLQHLERMRLFDALGTLRRLLRPRGRLLLSIPAARPDVGPDRRDPFGRLFSDLSADELERLLGRLGFTSIGRWHADDALGRPGVRWAILLLEGGSEP